MVKQITSSAAEGEAVAALATVGTLVRVTPWDDLVCRLGPDAASELVADPTPFVFRVAGWLEDGHIRYGLHGPVVDGPERYRGLVCSILTRADGSDWRVESSSSAAFKVGPGAVARDHRYDFRHPDGTTLVGYPWVARFGEVEVVGSAPDAEPGAAPDPAMWSVSRGSPVVSFGRRCRGRAGELDRL